MAITVKPLGTPNMADWSQGDRIHSVAQVRPGDVVLEICDQFEAQNLVRITRVRAELAGKTDVIYGVFVSPMDPRRSRRPDDREFAIWSADVAGAHRQLFRVKHHAQHGAP